MNYAGVILVITLLLTLIPGGVMANDAKIPREGTVFVGENDLDISECNIRTGDEIAFWTSGSPEGTPDARARVMDTRRFFVDPSIFSGKTGKWFELMTKREVFTVEDPWLQFEVVENGIDHEPEWIKRGNLVSFKIATNMYLISKRPGSAGVPVTIHLTGPNSTEFTQLISPMGTFNLENVYVYYSPYDTGAVWETKEEKEYPDGEYIAWASCNVNQIDEKNPGETITTSLKTTFFLSRNKEDMDKKVKAEEEEKVSSEKSSEKKETVSESETAPPITPEVTMTPEIIITPEPLPTWTPEPTREVTPKPTKPPLPSPPKPSQTTNPKQPLNAVVSIAALGAAVILLSRNNP